MSSQVLQIHHADKNSISGNGNNNKNEIWFDAFNFAPGQDQNIRWLNRPNQQLVQERYPYDIEKFRITFDVENFQPEQIKVNQIPYAFKSITPLTFSLDLHTKL